MKKILALVLALCMMMTACAVFAESEDDASAGSEGSAGLEDLFAGSDGEGAEGGAAGGLGSLISGLTGMLGEGGSKIGELISKLGDMLKGGTSSISALISSLGEKLAGSDGFLGKIFSGLSGLLGGTAGEGSEGGFSLDGLMSGLTGEGEGLDLNRMMGALGLGTEEGAETEDGGETETGDMLTDEEEAALDDLMEMLNKAEESGPHPVNKKEAAGIEEFYGDWISTRMYVGTEETAKDESNEGVHIDANGWYFTLDGAKDPAYDMPETAELKLEDGELKAQDGELWTTFVLTEEGELVLGGEGILEIYYVRVTE